MLLFLDPLKAPAILLGSLLEFLLCSHTKIDFIWVIKIVKTVKLIDTKYSEAATRGVLYKKVFLKISQNSQENTCARVSFLIKLQG